MFSLSDFFKILDYINGENVTDLELDPNTKILADNEKIISSNLFENTIDQIPHTTNDYKRLKNFLVDWYASHRTLTSTQKQSTDVFSLPSNYLDELLRSFGFLFSTTHMTFLTKANFFLDLVNLYKTKGTPKSLIDVLNYYGLTDADIAEYWLEKDSNKNLIFRSDRYLPTGVLDINFSNIDYIDMVKNDPHWRLSEPQIENLIQNNKIALPSKSPYFSIRPRYNLTLLNCIISIISRRVQDDHSNYISTGNLTKDIRSTKINFLISFLELYLACIYTYNQLYETNSSSNDLFYCYDGTSIPETSIIVDQYNNLIERITPSTIYLNPSRSYRINKINEFNNLFTRNISENFIPSIPNNYLETINKDLYDTINTYLNSGYGDEILNYLMRDLNSWIVENVGSGYPNLETTVLGFGSLIEINKIINFFKPYHSRMIKLEFALIINNPLCDSIIIEDDYNEKITEMFVDYDISDSTTSDLIILRKRYDDGSRFDLGASSDNGTVDINISENIEDILNFHDSTSSNAYEDILFCDTTSLIEFENFYDSTSTQEVMILSAGGWANFDESGIFDAQHGNDLMDIYIEDLIT